MSMIEGFSVAIVFGEFNACVIWVESGCWFVRSENNKSKWGKI